jgi:hypothetical protein
LCHPHKKQVYSRGVISADAAGQAKNSIEKWGKLSNCGFGVVQK